MFLIFVKPRVGLFLLLFKMDAAGAEYGRTCPMDERTTPPTSDDGFVVSSVEALLHFFRSALSSWRDITCSRCRGGNCSTLPVVPEPPTGRAYVRCTGEERGRAMPLLPTDTAGADVYIATTAGEETEVYVR